MAWATPTEHWHNLFLFKSSWSAKPTSPFIVAFLTLHVLLLEVRTSAKAVYVLKWSTPIWGSREFKSLKERPKIPLQLSHRAIPVPPPHSG